MEVELGHARFPTVLATGLSRRALLRGTLASGVCLAASALSVPAACASPDGPVLRSGDFPTFRDAVVRWAHDGGTLVVDRNHVEKLPITMQCVPGRSYRLTCDAPRTISYDGPQYHWFFCIYSNGRNPFVVDGPLTFDGANNCSMPFYVRFENVAGDARRDFHVSGLAARNARMKSGKSRIDGSPTNAYGASGMVFTGGFDHLVLRNVQASNVTREAGAGRTGHQGCVGICVTANLNGTQSPRHVLIEDFTVSHIDSDDAPGSPARGDMDGVLVFQSAEADGSRPIIQRGTIREAAGRAIKVYAPGGGGTTRDLTIYRSVHGAIGGSNDVAHQHGDGLIENITFYYSGNAHSQPTTPIGMSSGTSRGRGFPFGAGTIRNIRINDTTGRAKRAIVSMFYNVRDEAPRRYVLEDISDTGRAQYLLWPGSLGTYGPAEIVLENISVDLTAGLLLSEDSLERLNVKAHALTNRASRPVPFKAFYDGRTAPPGHGGRLLSDSTVRGVGAS